jgi:hypothetical protein
MNPRVLRLAGWILLVISFGIACITLYWGVFSDEADNLVVGSLIGQKYKLYRDVFSHHFPFPYYWMALFGNLVDSSILYARLSLLLFQTTAFIIVMRLSGNYLLVGLVAVLWSIARPFYKGNMILYSSFAGISLLVIYLVVISLCCKNYNTSKRAHLLTIAIFSIISLMSDPLSVYPITIAVIFLFMINKSWALKTSLVIIASLSLYAGYLLITGDLQAFWNSAILFNTQIYAKYTFTNPFRIKELVNYILTGLEITDGGWFDLDPFRSITYQDTHLDRWLFTGFLYRLSIILSTLFLLFRKQFRTAAFIYLFAASTLLINRWDFRGQPFTLVSYAAIGSLITYEWWDDNSSKYLKALQIGIGAVVLLMTGWLCVRLIVNIVNNPNNYGENQFVIIKRDSRYIIELTCNQPDVFLAEYPYGGYTYWYTGMKPVSKYIFMTPWVADIGLNDVIHELDDEDKLAVVIPHEDIVWSQFHTRDYLRPLYEFLADNYYQLVEGIYLSPALYQRCGQPN